MKKYNTNKKIISDLNSHTRLKTNERGRRDKHKKKGNIRNLSVGIFLSFIMVISFSGYVAYNLYTMQIEEHEIHAQAASASHYKRIVELPIRGSIFDRNGNELAFSTPVETIGITPSDVKSRKYTSMSKEDIASGLAASLDLPVDEVLSKMDMSDSSWVLLKKRISREQSEKLKTFRQEYEIGGIKVDTEDQRVYPQGNVGGNLIGFVSPDGIGQLGLEMQYNIEMTGEPGYFYAETDNYGQSMLPFSVPISLRARNGYNVITTVDIEIQKILEKELNDAVNTYLISEGGVAIIMDPYTGSILGMANTPGFDPNNPTQKPESIEIEEWNPADQETIDYLQEHIWRNKAISNTYEPGSTFKTMTAAMAMEEGKFFENEMLSNAPIQVADWTIQNLLWDYHGLSSAQEAFWRSSNPVFVQLSQRVGVAKFYDYLRGFGFYSKTRIDLPGEAVGLLHSDPKEIDMAVLSFGEQSTVTPLALINAYCALANGGYLMKPQMVRSITDSSGNIVSEIFPETVRQVVSENTSGRIKNLLEGVVLYGTGSSAYVEGYNIGGKTSTSTRDDEKTDISFMALAPVQKPEIAVLVVLFAPEEQYSRSYVAASVTSNITRQVLEYLSVPREYSRHDITVLGTRYQVPEIIGMTFRQAKTKLAENGFYIDDPTGNMADSAIIEHQYPLKGDSLHRGGIVTVYNRADPQPEMVIVPDVMGKNVNEAMRALTNAGMNIKMGEQCLGYIIEQEFEPGTMMERGSTIEVEFSVSEME